MTRFEVWAPHAGIVELVVGDERREMDRGFRGWWSLDAADLGPGTRYGFALDNGQALPDPRSRSQPDGVHGRSEVTATDFAWTDQAWRGRPLAGSVLYELHIGTFSPEGTFDGAISRLPHLVNLGVDAVELLPVVEFPGDRGWGYDGVDLFAPHHSYGGIDGLRRFVDACHANNIGVIFDVVYNHLGPSGNYLAAFGPYFTQRSTNWGTAINFDGPGSDEVRRFFIDNALMWLDDLHGDGLRLDAVHAIEDTSATHVLEQMAVEVEALAARVDRPLFLIAESDRNDPHYVRDRGVGGYGLDSAWADEWHHALHAFLTGEVDGYYEDFGSIEVLAKALRQAWVYDGIWSQHRQRTHGRSPAGLEGDQFVVSVQNHDQIGNRAAGDRIGATIGPERAKVAAALLLTSPFTPMLFQGEEWGASTPFAYFTAHEEVELGLAVTVGRRREFAHFGWRPEDVPDPQNPDTFQRSKLDWSEIERPEHRELLAWYRDLIALRRQHPDLSDVHLADVHLADTAVTVDAEASILDIRRGAIRIIANLGADPARVAIDGGPTHLLLASDPAIAVDQVTLALPPDSVAIVGPRAV